MEKEKKIHEEDVKVRDLQRMVDLALFYISAAPMDKGDAERLTDIIRRKALCMFPGKEETFEMIYAPRFRRVISRRFNLQ